MGFKSWLQRWKNQFLVSQQLRTLRPFRLKPTCSRFVLEELEGRVVPANITWLGTAGDLNWGTAANWSTDTVPTSADNVTISQSGSGTITIAAGTSAAVLSLDDTSAPLSIASTGGLTIAANGAPSTFGQNVTVGVGGTLTVGADVALLISASTTTLIDGNASFASGDQVTIASGVFSQEIEVAAGGLLAATNTTFNSNSIFNDALIAVNSNGQFTATNCTFASNLEEVNLNTGCIVNSGDFTGNSFNCPLYIPVNDVQYLSGTGNSNLQFQDVELLAGNVPTGQTLALNAIGTANTANLAYFLTGNLTVDAGATLTVAANVPVTLDNGYTLLDEGTASFATGDLVTIDGGVSSQEIEVGSGGLLSATDTTFSNTSFDNGPIVVNSNAHFTACGCTFSSSVQQVDLNTGCIVNSGDFTGNIFNCPLYVPVNDVQYLSGTGNSNLQFEDVELLAGSVATGQTLALNAIGTATTNNLAYFLTGNLTVDIGATLTVAANIPVTLDSGFTVLDEGDASFSTGDLMTINGGGSSTEIEVGSGAVLTAVGTTFSSTSSSSSNGQIVVNSNGHFTASSCTFASSFDQVVLNSGSILNSGDFAGDSFSCPLYLPESDVQDLSGTGFSNIAFEDIEILAGTLTSAQTLALNEIGTSPSSLAYFFDGNFTVTGGATLTVAAGIPVTINASSTLTDDGTVTFNNGDQVTLTGTNSTQQILVGSGGHLTANGITVTSTGSGTTNLITVNSGGVLNAQNCGFALTTLTLAPGSTATLQYNTFSSQLAVDSAASITVDQNDFSNIPTSPVNDGILATGSSAATINLTDNYWGTTVASQIAAKILDHNVSSSRPLVVYSPLLSSEPTQTLALPVTATYSNSSQNVTLTADVTSPSGVVSQGTETFTILSGSTIIGSPATVNVTNGVASTPYTLPAGTAIGSYTIQDVYNGSSTYNGSSDASQLLTVNAEVTSTTAANESVSYSSTSQSANLSATVTSSSGSINAGTVTFTVLSGSTVIGSPVAVNVNSGTASASYTLPAGTLPATYLIQAVYSGTSNIGGSFDSSHTLTVTDEATSTTSGNESTAYSTAGQSVNVSASVAGTSNTVNVGTVTFTVLSGSTVIGSPIAANVIGGTASTNYLLPASTAVGNYTIEAVFNGASNFLTSTDTSHTLTIFSVASTTAAQNVSADYSAAGQAVSLVASVASPAGTVNEGTVTFTILNGTTVIGTQTTVNVSSGVANASYNLASTATPATYTIKAVYNGTANIGGSNDSSHTLTLSGETTSTATSNVSATYNVASQSISLGATVTGASDTINAGTVTFTILNGSTVIGTPVNVNVSSGSASTNYVLPAGSPVGAYTLDAAYNGTSNFITSSDTSHILTINSATATTTALNSSTIYNVGGQIVPLSASVTSASETVNEGTETFTLFNGGSVVGSPVTVNVSSGTATASYTLPSSDSPGVDTIQAVYNGTVDFSSSTDSSHTLTLNAAPSVITNPITQTIDSGSTITLLASASGYPAPTVQWQISTNGGSTFSNVSNNGVYSGATTNSLTIANAAPTLNGDLYQAVFTNTTSPGLATTTAATLTVESAPAVTTNPFSKTINAGSGTSFTVAASGNPSPTVQWQVSTDNGVTYTNLSNGGVYSNTTSDTLNISGATGLINGDLYQAVFSNTLAGAGSPTTAATTAASLTVDYAPTVISNPINLTINSGNNATLTASASGSPTPTVQWQISTDGGNTYTNLNNGGVYNGTTTGSLLIAGATNALNGYDFRAIFSNTLFGANSPSTTTSAAASLTVDDSCAVTANPSTTSVNAGNDTSFTASASGYPMPTVQWQVSTDGGTSFNNVIDGGVYSGATSNALNITGATATMTGDLYQAVFTNTVFGAGSSNSVTTTAATLTVDYAPTVTTDPTSQTLDSGGDTSLTVAAAGNPTPTVQWQVSTNNGTNWFNVSNGGVYSGAASDTLQISNAPASMNGYEYQAVFVNFLPGDGSPSTADTTPATLTVDYSPTVSDSPINTTVNAGSNASLTAAANGNPAPTVRWEVSTNNGGSYSDLSNGGVYSNTTSDTLNITGATAGMNGYLYEAVFTNTLFGSESPDSIVTSPAVLAVDSAASVVTDPTNQTIDAGSNTSFTVAGAGNPTPTVQWQVSTTNGSSWTNVNNGGVYSGATSDTLQIANATSAMNGDQYQAIFSNTISGASSSTSAATSTAALTIDSAPTITSNPTNQTIMVGGHANFVASATGYPTPTVQWQVSTDNGSSWSNVNNGGVYSGATSDTLQITNATSAMDGSEYQAVFSNRVVGSNSPQTTPTSAAMLGVILPGDPGTSTVTVSNAMVQAGNSITVSLQAKDSQGDDLTVGGLSVAFALASTSGGQGTLSAVTDNQNGTYTATFTGKIAGSNTIIATIGGVTVGTTPPSIEVTPGSFSLANSIVSVSLSSVQLGGKSSITLQAEDAFGNDETGGGQSIAFQLEKTTGGQGAISSTTDNNNGTYTATFIGTTDGNNSIEAFSGNSVLASTAPIAVTGAAFSTSRSIVGVSSSTVQSGSPTPVTVTLQVENTKESEEVSGGLTVAFKLGSSSGGQGTFGPVIYNGNGIYMSTFTGTLAGSNTIKAVVNGQTVVSRAPSIKVSAGQVSLATSVLTLSSSTVVAGGKVTITFQPEDAAGNKVTANVLPVSFELGNGTGRGTFAPVNPVKRNGNGTYTATFTGSIAGGNTIVALVGGQAITSTAPVITVTPGAVSETKSVMTLSSGTVQSGGVITITLQAEDLLGNLETSGGLAVAFELGSTSGGQGSFSAVTDNKNGTYTVSFLGTTPGFNTIVATIGGKKLTPTPPVQVT